MHISLSLSLSICVYIYIYIYIYTYIISIIALLPFHATRSGPCASTRVTPNLPTNIVDFRGFDSNITLMPIRGFPGKFESSNVSRDNISREIGRSGSVPTRRPSRLALGGTTCLTLLA